MPIKTINHVNFSQESYLCNLKYMRNVNVVFRPFDTFSNGALGFPVSFICTYSVYWKVDKTIYRGWAYIKAAFSADSTAFT